MTFFELAFAAATCLVAAPVPEHCLLAVAAPVPIQRAQSVSPQHTGQAVDVIISAEAALVWDMTSQEVL